jgi:hypothetical protein
MNTDLQFKVSVGGQRHNRNLLGFNRRFRGAYCLHIRHLNIHVERIQTVKVQKTHHIFVNTYSNHDIMS